MAKAEKTCDHCGAPLVKSDGGLHCSAMCGHEVRSTKELHKILITNLEEIKRDCAFIGVANTARKWGLSMNTLYKNLDIQQVLAEKRLGLITAPSTNGATPNLPEFSNDWVPEVQLKWLEIWEKLKVS